MDALTISPTLVDVREQWLRRRASIGEAAMLLGLLPPDEESEVSVRGMAADLLVVTTTRMLLLRDGAVLGTVDQHAVSQVTVDADGRGARLCIHSAQPE